MVLRLSSTVVHYGTCLFFLLPPVSPKDTSAEIIDPSGPMLEGSWVTLSCNSKANPPVEGYTWYRVDGDQVTLVGFRMTLTTEVTKPNSLFYCEARNQLGEQKSPVIQLSKDMQCKFRHSKALISLW